MSPSWATSKHQLQQQLISTLPCFSLTHQKIKKQGKSNRKALKSRERGSHRSLNCSSPDRRGPTVTGPSWSLLQVVGWVHTPIASIWSNSFTYYPKFMNKRWEFKHRIPKTVNVNFMAPTWNFQCVLVLAAVWTKYDDVETKRTLFWCLHENTDWLNRPDKLESSLLTDIKNNYTEITILLTDCLVISCGSDSSSFTIKLFNNQLKTPCRMFNKLFCRSQYMMCTHQNGALKIGGHPSEQQPSHQTGDGGKDESSTQSPGHREVISWTGSVHRDPGQVTTVTWGRRRDHIDHITDGL